MANSFTLEYGEFVAEGGQWQYTNYLSTDKPNPLRYVHNGGGITGALGWEISPTHVLLVESAWLHATSQRFGLERSSYINPDIDTLRKVSVWYPSFFLKTTSVALIQPTWKATWGAWTSSLQGGLLLQAQRIPQTGAMNYIQYPDSEHFSYEHELYGESEIYAQVFTARTQAQQFYAHPYIERRWEVGDRWVSFRLGGWYSVESHRFRARQLGFMTDTAGGGPAVLDPAVYALDNIRQVYDPAYIRPGGWYLIERTSDFHRHTGRTHLGAGYAWLRLGAGLTWEALIGARYEYWHRRLTHIPIATERDTTFALYREHHLLPAVLLKYHLGERHLLKGGASMTLLRPSLPAQVPMRYFDYHRVLYWSGDPTVRTGRSYNAEIRYEWLRDKNRLFAVGLFYKHLRHLPEIYLIPASYALVFSYATRTRPWGDLLGLEVEARQVLVEHKNHRLWSYLTLTLSESAVETQLLKKLARLEGRFQGHAPIVSNFGLIYTHRRYEVATFLNYTAAQIWAIGFDPNQFPHILEEGRLSAETQLSLFLSPRWEIRLAIWDFINQPYRHTQRLGNAPTFQPDHDATPYQERWAYRGYVTIRYRL